MGIFCEINLFKPLNGAYQPGQVVSGMIKYAVDEPTEFNRITTSLKGNGYVVISFRQRLNNNNINRNNNIYRNNTINNNNNRMQTRTYRSSEIYVDLDNVIHDMKIEAPVGCYETNFNFLLPHSIPSSLNYKTIEGRYRIKCKILYYIRIKFERPGIFSFNKHFRKEITVISGGMPSLLREPAIYETTKKLIHMFACNSSVINIKVNIMDSVIPLGGKIDLNYEIENNSKTLVKSVKIQLVEVYTFKATGLRKIRTIKSVPNTDSKTSSISSGDTQTMPIQINVSSDIHTLQDSNMVSREYFVRVTLQLPIPHINEVIDMPVQIGAIDVNTAAIAFVQVHEDHAGFHDPPPSYWEAMGEVKKEDDVDSD